MILLPSEMKTYVRGLLPDSVVYPNLTVTPRDKDEKRCPAYAADHYELTGYYSSFAMSLEPLLAALRAIPEVYRVTWVGTEDARRGPADADWPVQIKNPYALRPMVRALMREVKQ